MICPNCGKELPDGAKFCLFCGKVVSEESQKLQEQKPSEVSIPNQSNDNISQVSYSVTEAKKDNTSVAAETLSSPRTKHLSKQIIIIIAISVAVLIILIAVLLSHPKSFTPQDVTEEGVFDLSCGENIDFTSIESTLKFLSASVTNINYDAMTVDLIWDLQLTPKMNLELQSGGKRSDLERYKQWISSINIEGSQTVPTITVETDASSNSIVYCIAATVQYNEDPSILNCTINDSLSIVLKNIFHFSPEAIMMEKAKIFISDEQYDAAIELLQKVDNEEARTAIEGINFIGYAKRFSDTSVWQLSDCLYLSMLGYGLDFDYDPVTYTYTMYLQIPSYWETLIDYGLGDESQLGDNVSYKEAKALYEKFSADGYPGVTCRVLMHNSANKILDEGIYTYGSS